MISSFIRAFPIHILAVAVALPSTGYAQVTTTDLSRHIRVLASDAFEGRSPGTDGETKSVAYITQEFARAGLQPGGDKRGKGRAWTQDVPLARFEIKGPVKIGTSANGHDRTWTQGEQVAIRATQNGATQVRIDHAPIVFVGYGVRAPERDWDDFKGIDLHGKIALVLVNDPDFETGHGDFGGKAMTYYGRWTYKYEEAARQGALGVLIIHETAPAGYGWNTVKNSNTNVRFDIVRKDPAHAHVPLEGWLQRSTAIELLHDAGVNFETVKTQAQRRDFKPFQLQGVTLSAAFDVATSRIISHNVVGIRTGTHHADEHLIYSAHWDHLGISAPDSSGDRIYNGAVDNASGISMLIEIARLFGHAPRPDRSVLFIATTAEEKGLLGATYYAENPLYPLSTTVADINMDGAAVDGPTRDVSVAGNPVSTLTDDLIAGAKLQGRSFSPDPRPQDGEFFRADHFAFAMHGVPSLTLAAGLDLVNGGTEKGKALQDAYIRDHYHQPSDAFDPNWDLSGAVQDVELLYEVGSKLASTREWPKWAPGAEFAAARASSASARQ